jgi:hypothetical protein
VKNRKRNSTIKRLFKAVKNDLSSRIGTLTGLSQTDILQRFLQMDSRDDGLPRTEYTFNN